MAIPSSPGRPSGRKSARPFPRVGVLHHLAAVFSLAGLGRGGVSSAEASASAPQRRRRQRLALVQRLLDPLPAALRPSDTRTAELFWRALRWGGGGILLARWLGR